MEYVEVVASCVSLLAAFIMTLGKPSRVWIAMALWTLGSVLWFTVGYYHNMYGLMIVNAGFFFIEGYGLYRWFKIKDK